MRLNLVIKVWCIYSIQEQSGEQLELVDDSELEPGTDVHTVTTTPYLQYVENSEFEAGVNVYPSSVYPTTATSPTSTTYLDTTTYAGLPTSTSDTNQSQLVSYGGITFLIQPSPDGSSTPLIMVVSRQDNTESPSIVSPGEVVSSIVSPGEVVSPSHSLSYITCVSPATIQWLIANYEAAEGVPSPNPHFTFII